MEGKKKKRGPIDNNKHESQDQAAIDHMRTQAEEKEFHSYYDLKAVKMIYALLFGCNFLINIDHGTIPASTLNLKSDLGLDNVALGFLGSIVFLGLTFGNLVNNLLIVQDH